jgi:hypothetical protein
MGLVNVSRAVLDPRIAQSFQIERSMGEFDALGNFVVSSLQVLSRVGVIVPANADDVMLFLPEGERTDNKIMAYSNQSLLLGDDDGLPDIILYNGERYKIIANKDYSDYGYWHALAEKIS